MFFKKSITVIMVMSLVLFCTAIGIKAHCLWVETPMNTEVGEEFVLPIFFGHPDEPIDERDMTEFSLFALRPGGELEELSLESRDTFKEATIGYKEEGLYTFIAERVPSRYRLTEIRDFGKSMTLVQMERDFIEPVGIPLEIHPLKKESLNENEYELTLIVLYEGEPLPGAEIEIFQSLEPGSNLYEEIDEVEVHQDGIIRILLDHGYQYVFETDNYVSARDVDGTSSFVTQVRFRSTLFIGAF